jgi:Domain of unknown function (DUF4349)
MRIIPFPGGAPASPDEAWLVELEAALNGESEGAVADSWRELRHDVRALAPSIAPGFEERIRDELDRRIAGSRGNGVQGPELPTASSPQLAASSGAVASPAGSGGFFGGFRRLGQLRPLRRSGAVAALAAAAALVAALVIAAPWRTASQVYSAHPAAGGPAAPASAAGGVSAGAKATQAGTASREGAPASAPATAVPLSSAGATSTPGRAQQVAASVSLSATPANVQATSDSVARIATRDEGFVESSHVQVQQQGPSEASLVLRLPSTRLSAALASIGQLAPVSAESQSLQDITDTYDAARRRLADVTAERQALLRALSTATTERQIVSLRERLSHASSAVAQARSALQAVSQRASTAEVEVTIVGNRRASSEGLTLHRGLHDAGRVLVVALVVLLIAAAILVPLALVLAALAAGGRAWRRYQRERVLHAP